MRLSVAIPTHDMANADFFLRRSLDSLSRQSFKDFEVVISDNADTDVISSALNNYTDLLDIAYVKNPIKGMAPNTNNAMRYANGEIIKILYLDDFLAHDDALKLIDEAFGAYHWLVTSCKDEDGPVHHPHYDDEIYTGKNTIGSPSVLAVRNEPDMLLFDENMTWLLDCDYYKRAFDTFGFPRFLKDVNVTIGRHSGQMTNLISNEIKGAELIYSQQKHG